MESEPARAGPEPVIVFQLNATVPATGDVAADPDTSIFVTFNLPEDFSTVTHTTVKLFRDDGAEVPGQVERHEDRRVGTPPAFCSSS